MKKTNGEEDDVNGDNDNKDNNNEDNCNLNLADQNLELPSCSSDLDIFKVESWLRQKTSSIS